MPDDKTQMSVAAEKTLDVLLGMVDVLERMWGTANGYYEVTHKVDLTEAIKPKEGA